MKSEVCEIQSTPPLPLATDCTVAQRGCHSHIGHPSSQPAAMIVWCPWQRLLLHVFTAGYDRPLFVIHTL